MKKSAYEPHPRLATKVVPDATEYDRRQNRQEIDEQMEFDMQFEADEFVNADGDVTNAQELYEHGFSVIMPE